jgi:hypothetical protein
VRLEQCQKAARIKKANTLATVTRSIRFPPTRETSVPVAGLLLPVKSLTIWLTNVQPPFENTPDTARSAAPASIPMGGNKSVTRFFVTSKGLGKGGDLGGLTGADAPARHWRMLKAQATIRGALT